MQKPIRVWFEKTGPAIYISHLDLNRCMARAIRRAKLPIWYTEGFHPHPYLTFPLPLSLGVHGLREAMDLRLVEEVSFDQVKERLNRCLPQGLVVTGVGEPVKKAKEIAFAAYELTMESKEGDAAALVRQALDRDSLPVEKKTKSGVKDVDIRPHLHAVSVEGQGVRCVMKVPLPCGPSLSINPSLLSKAVTAAAGMPVELVKTVRLSFTDGQGKLFE